MLEKLFWMLMGAVCLFVLEIILCAWGSHRENQAMQRAIEKDFWRQ